MDPNTEIEEDFLTVDHKVPGQNFVCLSFISPEKIIKSKETFILHEFLKSMCEEYKISEDNLIDKFDDFKYKNEADLTEKFTEENDFCTNVRGVKIRGVYDTKREADVRAKVLQRQDKHHSVFVGQVGYWLPWDPSLSYLDKVEGQYLDNDLNALMQKYNENQENKDVFFQEMVKEKTTTSKEISDKMTENDDPWMQKVSDNKDELLEKKQEESAENIIVEEVSSNETSQ
tara:strand:+ start:62 stop:751 length:690 start_codon:yes stop_codon:yes gene_type:complete